MSLETVWIVGGSANGGRVDTSKPVPAFQYFSVGKAAGAEAYTLRRCFDPEGLLVLVYAPAGRPVDRSWLAKRSLRN